MGSLGRIIGCITLAFGIPASVESMPKLICTILMLLNVVKISHWMRFSQRSRNKFVINKQSKFYFFEIPSTSQGILDFKPDRTK